MDSGTVTPIRTQIVIAPHDAAARWISTRRYPCRTAERPSQLEHLEPARTHLVILPEWRRLHDFLLLQVEVRLLQRHGARVEFR